MSDCSRNDVVPIVMGAHPEDYRRSAPRNSYIHVDDFESPQKLAEYLKELDADDDKYNAYFRWKVSSTVYQSFASVSLPCVKPPSCFYPGDR